MIGRINEHHACAQDLGLIKDDEFEKPGVILHYS